MTSMELLRWTGLFLLMIATRPAMAAEPASAPAAPASTAVRAVAVPRISGRLHAEQLGVVVNLNDPYSVATAAYYQQQRHLADTQLLGVRLPVKPRLEPQELDDLRAQIKAHFGPHIQALALVWRQPYAVACQSITAGVSLGFQPALCANSCGGPCLALY